MEPAVASSNFKTPICLLKSSMIAQPVEVFVKVPTILFVGKYVKVNMFGKLTNLLPLIKRVSLLFLSAV